ncbi:MAG: hemerythrin family protein [Sedimentisphaerales bacterium]|nr:hemerythrin family protein [Sedimentisphaerales bacterium]
MKSIDWNSTLSAEVDEIDNQHSRITRIIDKLQNSLESKQSETTAHDALADMSNYATAYFHAEEKNMHRINYPSVTQHEREHEQFVDTILQFVDRTLQFSCIDNDNYYIDIATDLLAFLEAWLINHINKRSGLPQVFLDYSLHATKEIDHAIEETGDLQTT